MNRDTILKVLGEQSFGQYAADVEAVMQPAIHIKATALAARPMEAEEGSIEAFDDAMEALPLGASRFGGLPDLPAGTPWPERDGVPMEFVAQLRLADLAGLDPLGRLPADGTLVFFYNSQWTTSDQEAEMGEDEEGEDEEGEDEEGEDEEGEDEEGEDEEGEDEEGEDEEGVDAGAGAACCAVLYFPEGTPLERATAPRVEYQGEYDEEPRLAPYIHGLASLSFTPYTALPGGVSPYADGALREFWQDFNAYNSSLYEPEGPANHVLGYADAQDYIGAHVHGTEDQLLLQVDSDDAADFQWGDCDRLYFMLTKAQLAARDFAACRIYSLMG